MLVEQLLDLGKVRVLQRGLGGHPPAGLVAQHQRQQIGPLGLQARRHLS